MDYEGALNDLFSMRMLALYVGVGERHANPDLHERCRAFIRECSDFERELEERAA